MPQMRMSRDNGWGPSRSTDSLLAPVCPNRQSAAATLSSSDWPTRPWGQQPTRNSPPCDIIARLYPNDGQANLAPRREHMPTCALWAATQSPSLLCMAELRAFAAVACRAALQTRSTPEERPQGGRTARRKQRQGLSRLRARTPNHRQPPPPPRWLAEKLQRIQCSLRPLAKAFGAICGVEAGPRKPL